MKFELSCFLVLFALRKCILETTVVNRKLDKTFFSAITVRARHSPGHSRGRMGCSTAGRMLWHHVIETLHTLRKLQCRDQPPQNHLEWKGPPEVHLVQLSLHYSLTSLPPNLHHSSQRAKGTYVYAYGHRLSTAEQDIWDNSADL